MPGRILIADDTPTRELVQQAVAAAGLVTVLVATGDEALSHGLSGRYDLLVLDVGLPRRDGLTVVSQLRGAGVFVPVILLGMRDCALEIAAGLDAGADDYMIRPLRTDELLARIRLRIRTAYRGVARPRQCRRDPTAC